MPNFDEYDNVNKYGYTEDGYKSTQLTKTTQDDWKPNLPGNTIKVRVSFRLNSTKQIYSIYICAIGASNYRFELEYQTTIRDLADKKYQFWVDFLQALPDEVGKQMFIELGMAEKEV